MREPKFDANLNNLMDDSFESLNNLIFGVETYSFEKDSLHFNSINHCF